jgi:hypothetical protein
MNSPKRVRSLVIAVLVVVSAAPVLPQVGDGIDPVRAIRHVANTKRTYEQHTEELKQEFRTRCRREPVIPLLEREPVPVPSASPRPPSVTTTLGGESELIDFELEQAVNQQGVNPFELDSLNRFLDAFFGVNQGGGQVGVVVPPGQGVVAPPPPPGGCIRNLVVGGANAGPTDVVFVEFTIAFDSFSVFDFSTGATDVFRFERDFGAGIFVRAVNGWTLTPPSGTRVVNEGAGATPVTVGAVRGADSILATFTVTPDGVINMRVAITSACRR